MYLTWNIFSLTSWPPSCVRCMTHIGFLCFPSRFFWSVRYSLSLRWVVWKRTGWTCGFFTLCFLWPGARRFSHEFILHAWRYVWSPFVSLLGQVFADAVTLGLMVWASILDPDRRSDRITIDLIYLICMMIQVNKTNRLCALDDHISRVYRKKIGYSIYKSVQKGILVCFICEIPFRTMLEFLEQARYPSRPYRNVYRTFS